MIEKFRGEYFSFSNNMYSLPNDGWTEVEQGVAVPASKYGHSARRRSVRENFHDPKKGAAKWVI